MVAPTAPSLSSLAIEAVLRAGYVSGTNQYTTALSRAQSEWAEEIKADIFTYEKKLQSLMVTTIQITNPGVALCSRPSDYSSDLVLTLLDGRTGVCQTGAAGSITLDTTSYGNIIGKEILIYAGTGKNSISQITSYDDTTKIATVSPDFVVAPIAGDSFMVVDTEVELTAKTIKDYSVSSISPGTPNAYSPVGDSATGKFYLYPAPYRTSGIPWAIKQRYFADLTLIDLSSATLLNLYRKFRNLFIQGMYAKALPVGDDQKTPGLTEYYQMIKVMCDNDKYGVDVEADLTVSLQRR